MNTPIEYKVDEDNISFSASFLQVPYEVSNLAREGLEYSMTKTSNCRPSVTLLSCSQSLVNNTLTEKQARTIKKELNRISKVIPNHEDRDTIDAQIWRMFGANAGHAWAYSLKLPKTQRVELETTTLLDVPPDLDPMNSLDDILYSTDNNENLNSTVSSIVNIVDSKCCGNCVYMIFNGSYAKCYKHKLSVQVTQVCDLHRDPSYIETLELNSTNNKTDNYVTVDMLNTLLQQLKDTKDIKVNADSNDS